jgi:hypothetical protein
MSRIDETGTWQPSINMNITNAAEGTGLAAATHLYADLPEGLVRNISSKRCIFANKT